MIKIYVYNKIHTWWRQKNIYDSKFYSSSPAPTATSVAPEPPLYETPESVTDPPVKPFL